MAAEALAAAGRRVDVFDAMPSVGRKFLLAGKGGLNLTHAEPFDAFVGRYGARARRARSRCCAPSAPRRCATGRAGWASTPSSAARAASSRPT
ncbi:MAG: NAD(P)/FAD-dependent oxidoreductase [Comamonadaceae bacterium]|nr:NAD(P)/FAD-dependent oxidoreductase [Comamonadaceae bacterium]